MKRFAFVYFMKDSPLKIREVVPYHVDYWTQHRLDGYVGGPFADRTGGLISFAASSLAEASALVADDPFSVHGLLDESWVKEWDAGGGGAGRGAGVRGAAESLDPPVENQTQGRADRPTPLAT